MGRFRHILFLIVYFHRSYPAGVLRILVVVGSTPTEVERRDTNHLVIGQCEIKDADILYHPLFVHGLGNDHHATLKVPAQNDLSDALPVFLCNLCDDGIAEYVVMAFSKWCPGLVLDVLLLHKLVGRLLHEERMRLNLVDGRPNLIVKHKVYQAVVGEARHTNGTDAPHPFVLTIAYRLIIAFISSRLLARS